MASSEREPLPGSSGSTPFRDCALEVSSSSRSSGGDTVISWSARTRAIHRLWPSLLWLFWALVTPSELLGQQDSAEADSNGETSELTATAESPESEPAIGETESVRRDLPPPEGPPLSGEELEAQVYALATELRCPVCQGLSVASSPSPSALAMREEIRDLLAAGYSKDQVVAYFEGSYGEFVRLVPKAEGFNLLVWIVPILALLLGLGLVWRFAKGHPERAESPDEEDLEEFLAQVRDATQEASAPGRAGQATER